ncbi:MAG: pyrimidine-nucleoside phosphorylase [Defluviitaleaceae bacterium]|nr:pyrimidine-nucleoside phosphorylase [Defluviitaleaceae bacterium]
MRIYDIINKKKRAEALTTEEINFVVSGFTHAEIPDYQISALLMAICLRGMNPDETAALTMAMVASGDTVDLSELGSVTVDKHSTGGVGDKTTLAVVPIVAACGIPIAKMSGRGLGHTGGTIDKLEAIPNFQTAIAPDDFMKIVKTHGLCIAGQSANLAPADKKLYALRDVTATVDSIPLIAASIMSKKIAAGADAILLDVKTGSGAFMKTSDDARELAKTMVEIGNNCGRKTAALITDMSAPLGYAIGNSLELQEVVQFLKGGATEKNLSDLCFALAENMLELSGIATAGSGALDMAKEAVYSGRALQKLKEMVNAQGGDPDDFENPLVAPHIATVTAKKSGYLTRTDTESIGVAAMMLGAGRKRPEDKIDYQAGIILKIKYGDYVKEGQPIAELHTNNKQSIPEASEKFLSSLLFTKDAKQSPPLIHEKIGL